MFRSISSVGLWYDYFTGERVEGERVLDLQAPLNRIPIFVREVAVLAEGPAVRRTGEITPENRIEKIRVFGQ